MREGVVVDRWRKDGEWQNLKIKMRTRLICFDGIWDEVEVAFSEDEEEMNGIEAVG
jgi:hypothetical protein